MPLPRKQKQGRRPHVTKNKESIFTAVLVAYRTGRFTITSCCSSAGITDDSFYQWLRDNQEYRKRYEAARRVHDESWSKDIVAKARVALAKRVEGFEYDEVSQEAVPGPNGKAIGTKITKTRRYYPPNPQMVAFTLKNLDGQQFQDKQTQEISGPNGGPIPSAPQTVIFNIPSNDRTKEPAAPEVPEPKESEPKEP